MKKKAVCILFNYCLSFYPVILATFYYVIRDFVNIFFYNIQGDDMSFFSSFF